MSTTEQINAYLAWRSEREGRTIDVSPEAYERDQIIGLILDAINGWQDNPSSHERDKDILNHLGTLCEELNELEDN